MIQLKVRSFWKLVLSSTVGQYGVRFAQGVMGIAENQSKHQPLRKTQQRYQFDVLSCNFESAGALRNEVHSHEVHSRGAGNLQEDVGVPRGVRRGRRCSASQEDVLIRRAVE